MPKRLCKRKTKKPQTSDYISHCAATLILNCLCLCCACRFNLSTAYSSPSLLLRNCFNLIASLVFPPKVSLEFVPFLLVVLAVNLRIEAAVPAPLARLSSPIRPSSSSVRAIKACSRLCIRSSCASTRLKRFWTSGSREARREDWAA